jgi:capsular polysaccharide biosynthesis protein
MVSVGAPFVADHFDASFRTADEVEAFLNTPVLAAMPNNAA